MWNRIKQKYIRKKDEKNFLKALDELEKKMLLMGHHDYPAFCEKLKLQMPGEKV